ncbi:MAG: GCN5-related N-acetyltransferase [bacterium]|nr:GCN5-related N-acetyltransferase [bacterium]
MRLVFEPLHKKHDRTSFSSGQPALDDWFRKRASQDEKRQIARVFVAVDRDRANAVAGFYSLSAFTFALDSLPDDLARKLPRYDAIPASLIGRLARAETVRGKGVGELLLADAIKRILVASESIAVYAIVVAAKDEAAGRFYRSFGFIPFPDTPARLFLLTSTARAALAASTK